MPLPSTRKRMQGCMGCGVPEDHPDPSNGLRLFIGTLRGVRGGGGGVGGLNAHYNYGSRSGDYGVSSATVLHGLQLQTSEKCSML